MQWFNNLRILAKIMVSVVIATFFLVVVGGIGYYYTNQISEQMTVMYQDRLIPIKRLNETRHNFSAVHGMILEVILGNPDKVKEQKIMEEIKTLAEETNRTLTDYKKSKLTPFEQQKIIELDQAIGLYRVERQKALSMAQAGQRQEAYAHFDQNASKHLEQVKIILKELADYSAQASEKSNQTGESNASLAKLLIIAITILAVAISVIASWLLARMIARRLGNTVDTLNLVAAGDLTKEVTVTAQDEIGQMGTALNATVRNLNNLIGNVRLLGEQVAASSQQLTASSGESAQATNQVAMTIADVSRGTELQVSAVNESSAIVEQMSAGIHQIAANANVVAGVSGQAANTARSGETAVISAVDQMNNIERTVISSAEVVAKLGERSNEIGQIVDTISGIAGQTNLLALNAAIEAARAGEQGRGFAVVAEEVRKLAEQSQDAAKQIAGLISEIQGDTDKAVVAMSEGTREVKVGTDAVAVAGKAFNEIVQLIDQVSGQVRDISAAIQQMAGGSEKIVESVRDIDKISKETAGQAQTMSAATQEQSAAMEEIAASSQSLANMALQLQTAIDKFKV
ncbi:methyl-accepting chemotaxis protein [bacterium BFN5]|nr:methyl-accepting chemotaxis protein [bacterium BFN5]QJW48885.1 methyl-accepting chemotaxis protein [bacterium BFN5]